MNMKDITVEICVDSIESAIASGRGGAKRVELCCDLVEGGITPSAGLIATARKKISMGLHVMIRPRVGDFFYSDDEFDVMRRDVLMAKQLGAHGVVVGLLDTDGNVDVERTRVLVELARPLQTTFHRAFDVSADLGRALDRVVETGADRILTSGGSQTAVEGTEMLRTLVDRARGRVIIMAGGGIDDLNVQEVLQKAGIREIHAGLRTTVDSPMKFRRENSSMGTSGRGEYQRFVVSEDRVAKLVRAVVAPNPE
jgi:copper homeostasis protein